MGSLRRGRGEAGNGEARTALVAFEVKAVVPDLWDDLAKLFSSAPPSECWCMWPRLPVGAMREREPDQNRTEMKRLVEDGAVPGLLAYVDGRPAGWAAAGPRSGFRRLSPGRDPATWVIACLYVARQYRRSGVSAALIDAALRSAFEQGASMVEAILRGWRTDEGDSGGRGLFQLLREAGFEEVDAASEGVHFRMRLLP